MITAETQRRRENKRSRPELGGIGLQPGARAERGAAPQPSWALRALHKAEPYATRESSHQPHVPSAPFAAESLTTRESATDADVQAFVFFFSASPRLCGEFWSGPWTS